MNPRARVRIAARALALAAVCGMTACSIPATTGGIHARLAWAPDRLTVRAVPGDGPAHEAGLAPGDRILSIDGTPVAGLSERRVVERLRGPAGSRVSLEVERPGAPRPLSLTVERRAYAAPPPGAAP